MIKTLRKLRQILQETGLPVSYHHFNVGDVPNLPYIVFLENESDHVYADDQVYLKKVNISVELYSDKKNEDAELLLENIFDKYEISYSSYETWIESEKMYEKVYDFQIEK